MTEVLSNSTLSWILLAALACVVAMPLVRALGRNGVDWFAPIYVASAYFFLIFVLRGVYDLSFGSDFLPDPPFDDKTTYAFNCSLIYLIASYVTFFLSYYSSIGRRMVAGGKGLPKAWSKIRLQIGTPILIGLGIASVVGLIYFHGGAEFFSKQKQDTLTTSGQSYILIGTALLSYAAILSATAMYQGIMGKFWMYFGLTLAVLVGAVVGSKGMALSPILSFLVALHYLKSRLKPKHLVLFALVAIVVIPVFNAYRILSDYRDAGAVLESMAVSNADAGTAKGVMELFLFQVISRFHVIDSVVYIVRDTPGVMDFQFGATVSPLLVAWVPRVIWPEKPIISFGKIFGETYYRDFFFGTDAAPSPSVLGEAYINFHIFGMILIAATAGILLRSFYEICIRRNGGGPGVFLYAALFLHVFTFWETNIAGFVAEMLAKIAVLGAIVWLLRGTASSTLDSERGGQSGGARQ